MAAFKIGLVGYGRNPHARCFEDFARALAHALRSLGHEVKYAEPGVRGRLIMFGANNMTDPGYLLPDDAIIYNTEQVAAVKDPRYFMGNLDGYRKHVVWDYSRANAQALVAAGMERVVLCPVGYVPQMETTRANPPDKQDIDVVFAGSVNARRRRILDGLRDAGLRLVHLFDVYGAERDAIAARAKLVLNMHHYENAVYEIFRVSQLLANRVCVVSEDGHQDAELEAFAAKATRYIPYNQLVETCRHLCTAHEERSALAERGHAEFKKIDLVEHVRRALEASS